MSGLSTAGESLLLTTLMDGRYISLHAGTPGDVGSNECVGTPYERQPGAWAITGGNPSMLSNSVVIQYETAEDDWGTLSHFGVWTAVTGGTFLGGWPLLAPKTVTPGDVVRWDVGKLRITTDDL